MHTSSSATLAERSPVFPSQTPTSPFSSFNLLAEPAALLQSGGCGEFALWIDRHDYVVFMTRDWDAMLRPRHPLVEHGDGPRYVSLWDQIKDRAARHCYRHFVAMAREGLEPVSIPFVNAESPTGRALNLEITHIFEGTVEFRWEPIASRSLIPLTPRVRVMSGGIVRSCSCCRSVETESGMWAPLELVAEQIGVFAPHPSHDFTHGFCPACFNAARD